MNEETIFSAITILISLIALVCSIATNQRSTELAELSKASLEFHLTDDQSYFRETRLEEKNYKNSVCFAFVHVSMSNFSNLPLTIREFQLSVTGYDSCRYRQATHILPEGHILFHDPGFIKTPYETVYYATTQPDKSLPASSFIKMPCTFPPYGYHEGFLLFPYAPLYSEQKHSATLTAFTTRGDFSYKTTIYPCSVLDEDKVNE